MASAIVSGTSRTSMHGASADQHEYGSKFARSGAPSVDTRIGRRLAGNNNIMDGASGGDSHMSDFEDRPIIMEVRKIKVEPYEGLPDAPNAPAQPNVSFVSHNFTAIGDKVKAFNDTLGEFQSLGIQQVTNLPELLLVGDQSAGKSSLMSSFAGIYLPRSDGACTRCPVHIRLSGVQGSGAWSCRVSLQEDYEYAPPANVTRANPFGPWFEKRRDVKDFATLSDPATVEDTLRWAQIATLNPKTDHSLYKPDTGELWKRAQRAGGDGPEEVLNEAPFSPNTVALDISAPGLADLSFYDLPGVFTSARRDEDQYLVKVVENLTAKYISHQQAIILWAVPMNADPETSSTFSIIRRHKAQPRTIGIMTKADLLPPNPSASTQWMAMLRGEQHRVGHGYFVTARPVVTQNLIPEELVLSSQQDPRPVEELGRQEAFEDAFFNRQLPGLADKEWPKCFRSFDDRCGVSRLVAFMSQQLGHEFAKWCVMIDHNFIKEKVADKLLDVNHELSQLPDMPENPELVIRRGLAEFASQVRTTLEGTRLSHPMSKIVQQFRHEILALKPRYQVKADGSLPPNWVPLNGVRTLDASGRIDLTIDNDDVASVHSASSVPLQPDASRRRRQHADFLEGQHDTNSPNTPSKRPRNGTSAATDNHLKAETASDSGAGPSGVSRNLFGSRVNEHQAQQDHGARPLATVREIISAMSKPGMPNIVTGEVYDALCTESVQPWSVPLNKLLDSASHLLNSILDELLGRCLCNLRERLIFKQASKILRKLLVDELEAVKAFLQRHHRLECRKYYTLDKDSLQRYTEAEALMLTRHRHYYRMVDYLGPSHSGNRKRPKDWGAMTEEERARDRSIMEQEAAKLGKDPYSKELEVCAQVRGYYLTASTRFIDLCTLHIVSGLVTDISEKLAKWHVDDMLGVVDRTSPQTFIDLMGEDPATAEKRASLKADRRRFELTIEAIQRLEIDS